MLYEIIVGDDGVMYETHNADEMLGQSIYAAYCGEHVQVVISAEHSDGYEQFETVGIQADGDGVRIDTETIGEAIEPRKLRLYFWRMVLDTTGYTWVTVN